MREHKKFSLGILGWAMFLTGAMSLGSCSSDETLESIEPKAITFGSVTLENSSRATDPSYGQTTNLLDKFQVWGTVSGNAGTAIIFNGAEVARGTAAYGEAWNCNVTQYWIPSATYNFMAIANATNVAFGTDDAPSDLPTAINFELTDGSKDLLLGEIDADVTGIKTVTTNPTATPTPAGPVAFNMTHLLSKVHFTFDGSASNVKYIQVTGHYGSGTYNISNATWGSLTPAGTTALDFGGLDTKTNDNTSENARLIIPGKQTWTIKLLDSSKNEICEPIILNKGTATGTNETEGFTFEPNTQYNINISLGVDMALAVEVQDWEGVEVPNDFAKNVTVSSGYIDWTDVDPVYVNAAGQNIENETTTDTTPAACWVVFDKTKTSATFTFKIDAPMGGTWNAMLVTKQGTSEVFKIVKAGTDEELTSGKVGETYTLTIKTIEANASELANMAELRILVRQGGEILPANNLVYHGTENHPLNGKNYIMVQNK